MPDPVNTSQDHPGEGPAQRVGSVVKGKWRLDGLVGVGGMAAVYAASHRNGQRAALKILHTDFARDPLICERFLREAYVSNKVGHPATVDVLDDDVTELDEPFLIMELLEGETVRDAWKKAGRTMPVVQVLQIADSVLDCLAACHAVGIIHRDLKPANIFLTTENVVKLLDFGVAQMRSATHERTATGTALGTPAYMSPEQAMGLVDQLDGRADIFSMGAMMHALITGHRINNGRTEQEALVMAATKPAPSVARVAPNLPIEVIALVDKALAWDRRNRFTDAREMQTAVRNVVASLGGPSINPTLAVPRSVAIAPPPANAPAILTSREATAAARAREEEARAKRGESGSMPQVRRPMPSTTSEDNERELDARAGATRDILKHVERLLPSVRQFGWTHPATERSLRTTFEAIAELLARDSNAMRLALRPYSFMLGEQTVWEPTAPFDVIPYNLFACGVRMLHVDPKVTLDELRDMFALWLVLDPQRDLPPEDDLIAAFWERGATHVRYDAVDAFAEGDAAQREAFWSESDQVEELAIRAARAHASRVEARAMAVSTDRDALRLPQSSAPMKLDDAVKSAFAAQLDLPRERWSERYVDALVDGYLDAAVNRDAALVLASLRKSAQDLVVAGRLPLVISLRHALTERIHARVSGKDGSRLANAMTNALFGAETLALVIQALKMNADCIESFLPILAALSPNEIPTALNAIRSPDVTPAVREALVTFVERVLPGHENDVANAAIHTHPETSYVLVALLGRATTVAAKHALSALTQSDDVVARIEARILSAPSPDHAHAELALLLDNASALVRMAALRAITRYRAAAAWATIQRLVKQPNFNDLGVDERRELLRAIVAVAPDRGEPIVIELAKKSGMMISEGRETTRVTAIEVLGELSRSTAAISALREIAQARWGTSDETRAAANDALRAIGAPGVGSELPPPGGPS